ncbi:MAG: ECF transporter S component [Lachnospiraceae bacterium]
MQTKKMVTRDIAISGLFIAIGIILPFFTGNIPLIGNMLLPMHIPVLFCGLICGWKYGTFVGAILPIVRYFLFGMPILFPIGIAMAFEMATYGFIIGIIYFKRKKIVHIYYSLISAMVLGRVVWGIVMYMLLKISGGSFTMDAFVAGAFLNAIPGIIIQLILIPMIMIILDRVGIVLLHKGESI